MASQSSQCCVAVLPDQHFESYNIHCKFLLNNTLLYQLLVSLLIQVILSSFNNAKNIQSANGFKEKEQLYKFQNVFLNPFVIHYNLLQYSWIVSYFLIFLRYNIYWTCVKLVPLKPINIFYEIDQLIYSPNTYMWHIPTATFSLTKTSANPLTPNCSMVLFNFYKVIKLFFNRAGEYLQNTCTSKKNIHAIFINLIFFNTGRFKLKLT